MNTSKALPAIWMLVLIAGLPQLSENIYTTSLPAISIALNTLESYVEYTLTIYLFGFAVGVLFWGRLSDRLGRKPCVIAGLIVFCIGCLSCYFSNSIEMLLISRFIQAFGGSIGSVLGQSICRDSFSGSALGKAYSSVGTALAFFPMIGPLIGGIITQYFMWFDLFLFLMICAILLLVVVVAKLPETLHKDLRQDHSILTIASKMLKDKRVLCLAFIVGIPNGILFSYFAEAPFYFIKSLHLSPIQYGYTFIAISIATMAGGFVSRLLHKHKTSEEIMIYGVYTIAMSSLLFTINAVICNAYNVSAEINIFASIIFQMGIAFGICMTTSNALATLTPPENFTREINGARILM